MGKSNGRASISARPLQVKWSRRRRFAAAPCQIDGVAEGGAACSDFPPNMHPADAGAAVARSAPPASMSISDSSAGAKNLIAGLTGARSSGGQASIDALRRPTMRITRRRFAAALSQMGAFADGDANSAHRYRIFTPETQRPPYPCRPPYPPPAPTYPPRRRAPPKKHTWRTHYGRLSKPGTPTRKAFTIGRTCEYRQVVARRDAAARKTDQRRPLRGGAL